MRLAAITVLCLLLIACGGGGGGGGNQAPPPPTVTAFDVDGTHADTPSGRAAISPSMNSGNFTIEVNISDGVEYTIGLAVSNDATASSGDVVFLDDFCSDADDCFGLPSYTLDCVLNNQNRIGCTIDGVTGQTDLTAFLNTVPKDAFIIIEVCDLETGDECDYETAAVQFQ